jgi:hypothetical protein
MGKERRERLGTRKIKRVGGVGLGFSSKIIS